MPKKSKRTPQPKKIPAFNPSRARNYPVETDKTTPNPTRARRTQDLGSTGINKSKAIGLVFDASDMTGRSDKGKKRGPNTGRSRRRSVTELPSSLYRLSEGRQEGVRGMAGGVRQYGHTLQTSIQDTPVGGWGGLNPNQFARPKSETSGATSRASTLSTEIGRDKADLKIRVVKLDAPENDPKNFSDAKLDELVITRIQRKGGIDYDTAENKFIAMTEQAKQKLREEERQSLLLEKKKQKDRVLGDINRIADTQAELEQIIEEEEKSLSGEGARLGGESIQEKKSRILRAKIQLMEEFGQIDKESVEGKGRMLELIDEVTVAGERERALQPQPEPEPIPTTTAIQPSGPIPSQSSSVVLRLGGAVASGVRAGLDTSVSKGLQRELSSIATAGSNLRGAVKEAELSRRGRSEQQKVKQRLGQRFKDEFGEDSKRLEEALAKKFPKKPEEEDLNKQLNDRYYSAISEAELTRKAREQAIKTKEADKKLNRDIDRELALQRFRNRNRYGNRVSRINRDLDADEKRTKELKPVVDKFIDDTINDVIGDLFGTFPAEAEQQEVRPEVVRERRRNEIYAPITPSKTDLRNKEREELRKYKKQTQTQSGQAHKRATKFFLEKRLAETDPRFMSDDDLEAKAKSVSQRLRDEERLKSAIVDDIMEGETQKTITLGEVRRRPVLRLPQKQAPKPEPEPEPVVVEEVDSDDEFVDAEDFTPEQLARYQDAEHFGHKGLSKKRVKTIAEMEQDLRNAQQRAENERQNYFRKLAEKQGPEPPPRPPTEEEEFLAGIDENPKIPPPLPKRPPTTIETQTPPLLPPRDAPKLVFPNTEEIVRRVRGGAEREKPSQQRYARNQGAFLKEEEQTRLSVLKDELTQIKGYLDNFGFPRGLLGGSSKADRQDKDKKIAIKLSQLRNSPDYSQIQQAIARAIQLNQEIQKLNVKSSQLKKRKK